MPYSKEELRCRSNEYRRNLRVRALERYGRICACCGEDRFEFLALDHINGGGLKHRKEIGGSVNCGGNRLMLWMQRNNWPEGFRVLCHNCNQSIGHYGRCPHVEGS